MLDPLVEELSGKKRKRDSKMWERNRGRKKEKGRGEEGRSKKGEERQKTKRGIEEEEGKEGNRGRCRARETIELPIFDFLGNFTGPDLQKFSVFKLSCSMLVINQKSS